MIAQLKSVESILRERGKFVNTVEVLLSMTLTNNCLVVGSKKNPQMYT